MNEWWQEVGSTVAHEFSDLPDAAGVTQQAGVSDADLTRVLQGLVAGVGFLGAGAIVKGGGDEDIKGLTTAAGIWLTAAIGVAAGMGREGTAVLSTLLALVILYTVPKLAGRFDSKRIQR